MTRDSTSHRLKSWPYLHGTPTVLLSGFQIQSALLLYLQTILIVSGDTGGFVHTWDSRSQELIGKAGNQGGYISSVCFSPDSHWLVSGSQEKTVQMWDCRTGQAMGPPLPWGHRDVVTSVCADGIYIISGSSDSTVRIWSCVRIWRFDPYRGDQCRRNCLCRCSFQGWSRCCSSGLRCTYL